MSSRKLALIRKVERRIRAVEGQLRVNGVYYDRVDDADRNRTLEATRRVNAVLHLIRTVRIHHRSRDMIC